MDEIDKLSSPDQLALLNLMENGKLTKITKSESYEIDLKAWVFTTANNEEKIIDPLLDRFEAYYLTKYTDDQFRAIASKRLKQEGVENEELALFIANSEYSEEKLSALSDYNESDSYNYYPNGYGQGTTIFHLS